jgi:hypothetical protein
MSLRSVVALCLSFQAASSAAAYTQTDLILPYGTFVCVRNAAEESLVVGDLAIMPDSASFAVAFSGEGEQSVAVVEPIPVRGWPRQPVRMTDISVTRTANPPIRERSPPLNSSADVDQRRTLFIYGSGRSELGDDISFSDLWVGTENIVRVFKPRFEFNGMTLPVSCSLQGSERRTQ